MNGAEYFQTSEQITAVMLVYLKSYLESTKQEHFQNTVFLPRSITKQNFQAHGLVIPFPTSQVLMDTTQIFLKIEENSNTYSY
jgi:hypothetical protein